MRFGSAKTQALLAYLAIEAGRPHRRETLASLLWPDRPDRVARNNLRQTLSMLRSVIGDRGRDHAASSVPPIVLVTRETLQFNRDAACQVDVHAFQALIARDAGRDTTAEDLARAVALYRGDFLEGFFVSDSALFEDWTMMMRDRLQRQAAAALRRLIQVYTAQDRYADACTYAWRWVELEPWQESAHQQLMIALALDGRRTEALAQFEACGKILQEEYGAEPSKRTHALYERIRNGALWSPAPSGRGAQKLSGSPVVDTLPNVAMPASLSTEVAFPAPDRVHGPLARDAERRWVSLVLIDMTAVHPWERPGAEAWAEALQPTLNRLAAEAHRLGGDFYPGVGSPASIAFGVLTAREDDAERAVLAALAAQQAFAAHVQEAGETRLALRVSVHRADIVVTIIDGRPALVGEAFALAQARHATLQPGATWVDAATHDLIATAFSWQPLDDGHCPIAYLHPLDKGRGLPGLSAPLIGRDRELQMLNVALESLQRGIGGIVTVVGEAGIGKSRLVAEARKAVIRPRSEVRSPVSGEMTGAEFPDQTVRVKWTEGRCLAYAARTAFQPWADVLRALVGRTADTPPLELREALYGMVEAACAERAGDVYPLLIWLMQLPLDAGAEARLHGINAEGLRVLAFQAVEQLIAGVASGVPLVVVLEDLHWGDATSLALLEALLPLVTRVPVLFICVMRPETDHSAWHIRELADQAYRHRHTYLHLAPLTEAESADLAAQLFTFEALPAELQRRILTQADGNPFFLEEILRALMDAGALTFDAETAVWRASVDEADLPLPAMLHAILASRIDRLPEEARWVLQVASVIGRIVPLPLLAAVMGGDALDEPLGTLERTQLLRQRSSLPEVVYIFKHQLTQEAAYAGMLRRTVRALHRRVAEAIESRDAARIDERVGLLAHHWEQAGDASRARHYLRRAGEQAAARYANDEAVDYLSRALVVTGADEPGTRFDLLSTREGVYDLLGKRDGQEQDLAAMASIAEAMADRRREATVALRRAYLSTRRSNFEEAAALAERAVALACDAGDVHSEAMAYREWGRALRYLGRCEEALVPLERSLSLAEDSGLPDVLIKALHTIGVVQYYGLGNLSGSLTYFERALRLCRQYGDRQSECEALRDLAAYYEEGGQLQESMQWSRQALQVCQATGNRRDEGLALLFLGRECWHQGHLDGAVTYFEQALGICNSLGERFVEAWLLSYRVSIANTRGQPALARCYAERALGLFDTGIEGALEDTSWPGTLQELGDALAALGRLAEARRRYKEALARYPATLSESLVVTLLLATLAVIARDLGDEEGYRNYAAQVPATRYAVTYYRDAVNLIHLGRMLLALARWDQAGDAFHDILDVRLAVEQPHLRIEAWAGIAAIELHQGRTVQALASAEEALALLSRHCDLAATEAQVWAHLILYCVLAANADPRAGSVLDAGHRIVMQRAAEIEDEGARQAFLENVTVNREIGVAYDIRAAQTSTY